MALCAALIEREALPQAGRWHRRDLVPGATAAWRAVIRALQSLSSVSGVVQKPSALNKPPANSESDNSNA
jgi:hypothetical protein